MPSAQPNYLFRFYMGQIVLSPIVREAVSTSEQFAAFVDESLNYHAHCDWGSISPRIWDKNELAIREGDRIYSMYGCASLIDLPGDDLLCIITTADRSATFVCAACEETDIDLALVAPQ